MVDHIVYTSPYFEAAVQRMLTLVCGTTKDNFDSRDFTVEVITASQALDSYDIVMDFRDLEEALRLLLAPLQGQFLSDFSPQSLIQIALKLAQELTLKVPAPARLIEVGLIDNYGHKVSVHL